MLLSAGKTLMVVAVAGLTLTGCGSDDNIAGSLPTAGIGQVQCSGSNTLTGEGSTSQQNAIALFSQSWGQRCRGKGLSYNPTGSAAGRRQFIAGHVDFAGSDSPLDGQQVPAAARRCRGNPAWHLPLVFGQIVLAYHLDGVDTLVLDADVLARIFSGAITRWNDPVIAALNPAAVLPAVTITPIYRSDSSGTTDNFQQYLRTAAPRSWLNGAGSEFAGGAGEGAQKSAGVIQAVQTTPGAIGYVERGSTAVTDARFALLAGGDGPVAATDDAARIAIESATFSNRDGNDLRLDLQSLYGTRVPGAYPLVQLTYEIVCSKGYRPEVAAAVRSFLGVAVDTAQDTLAATGYVALPDAFKRRLSTAIDAIE